MEIKEVRESVKSSMYAAAEITETENGAVTKNDSDEKTREAKEEKKENQAAVATVSEEAKRMFLEQLEQAKEGNPYTDLIKLIEIANRISKGDKVPLSDEKKLLEKEPDMYLSAKMAASMRENKRAKSHKALFEDEEKSNMEEQLRELKWEDGSSESGEVGIEAEGAECDSGGTEGGNGES